MNIPKISIITTTYNDIDNLKAIIQEVQNQDYTNIEHIIVDGGSKDGTIEVLKNYKSLLGDKLIYISEKDSGIYDALNKGISLASGDIIGCCFDHYTSNHVISEIVNRIEKDSSDGVHGDLVYIQDDKIVRYWKQGEGSIYKGWMPGHPTLYLKREVYKKYGLYKTNYKISADYEFMIRILKDQNVKLSYINNILIHMSHGGTSTNSLKSYIMSAKEGHRALKENGVKFALWIDFLRMVRVLLQFVNKPKQNLD